MSEKKEGDKVLCNVDKVSISSLPRSLRTFSRNGAVADALNLARMLEEVGDLIVTAEYNSEPPDYTPLFIGMKHVYALMQDLLEIGAGVYDFPLASNDDDAPVLAVREGY